MVRMACPLPPILTQAEVCQLRLSFEGRVAYEQEVGPNLCCAGDDLLGHACTRQMFQKMDHRYEFDTQAFGQAESLGKPRAIGLHCVQSSSAGFGDFCRINIHSEAMSGVESTLAVRDRVTC